MFHEHVKEQAQHKPSLPINTVLCIDPEAIDRFGSILRHLVVGLVDQAVTVRVLSSDERIQGYQLGPVRTVMHDRLVWPFATRRTLSLLAKIIGEPPTTAHALSSATLPLALAINEAFESDIVMQITSAVDAGRLAEPHEPRIGHHIVSSTKLADELPKQGIPAERITLVRPGVRASSEVACFPESGRTPTIVAAAPFESGSRVDRLIDAVRIVREGGLEVMLFLLGTGKQESRLRAQVRSSGLSAVVTFAAPGGDPTPALTGADIFVDVAPPNALYVGGLQAMGIGLAIITGVNDFCDHYRANETVLVCDTSKATNIAACMERLVRDQDYARNLAGAGLEFVRSHHAWSGMVERTATVYRELALRRATFSLAK